MKKLFAAIISLAAACSMLTACGSSDSSSKSASSSGPESYEKDLRAMFEASNNEDMEALAKYLYPDELCEYLLGMGFEEALIEESAGGNKKKEITEIIEEEEIGGEDIKEFEIMLNSMNEMMKLAKEYDMSPDKTMDDLSEEDQQKIAEELEKIEDGDVSDSTYSVTKAYDVTVRYTQDGEEEEDSFYAYYVEDEGWLFEQSMREYVNKSKQSSMNSNANSLSKAIMSALTDLDAEGADVSGTYIIASIPAKDRNVPDSIDRTELDKKIKNYFSDVDKLYYFCLVNGGSAVYVVCEDEKGEYAGVYPAKSIPEDDSAGYFDYRTMTSDEEKLGLEELYDMVVDIIE